MFTRFTTSSIVNQQVKFNDALAGHPGLSLVVFQSGAQIYVNVPILSNALYFNYASVIGVAAGGCASTTRGLRYSGDIVNSIQFTTFASKADAQTFGTPFAARIRCASISSATRGVIAGGESPGYTNNIEYVTIASIGNGTSFGALTVSRGYMIGGAQSPTRGVFAGGWTGAHRNEIDYITTASAGNATSFGVLTVARYMPVGVSSDTRGIWYGGNNGQATIDYITIASTGNATSFGTAIYNSDYSSSGGSSNVRAVFAGTTTGRQIFFLTIASTGNGTDFGTSSIPVVSGTMQSNHGGLQ